jgi:hypothetical protein
MAKIIITIEDDIENGGVNTSWKFTPKTIRADAPPSAAIQVGQHCIGLIHQIAAANQAPVEAPAEAGNDDEPS